MIAINRQELAKCELHYVCPHCGCTTRPFMGGFIMCRHVWDAIERVAPPANESERALARLMGVPIYVYDDFPLSKSLI